MQTRSILCVLAALALAHSGCSLCCTPYDNHYVTTGGKHQRVDRIYGRVGSILSDPHALADGGTIIESPIDEPVEIIDDFESSIDLGDSDEILIPGADDFSEGNQVEFAGARGDEAEQESSIKID